MNKILIIEDDLTVVRIYENQLLMAGYEVRVAKDGQEGLEMLQVFKPEAVVLDLMLPRVSGLEFIRSVRGDAAFKQLPILVFSNASGTDMMREALAEGATKFLTKYNCPPKQLIEVLQRTISEPSQVGQVVFPAVAPPPPPAPPAKAKPVEAIETWGDFTPSLLMLEDNDAFAEVLNLFLESQSFQITRVTNGADGVRQIIAADFDAILCDLALPSLTGDQFYKAVERTKPHLCQRFVFMTGHREDAKWGNFVCEVGRIMLWKPFPLSDLLAALRIVINDRGKPASSLLGHHPNAPGRQDECGCLSNPTSTLN
jgi:DNA-binding response OmpR family regulator